MFDKKKYWKKYYTKNKEKLKKRNQDYYYKNKERIRGNNRLWLENNSEYYKKYRKEYRKSSKNKEDKKAYRKNHPKIIIAERKAQKIKLDSKCLFCSKTTDLVRHHPNYDSPLRINTLCRKCHSTIHNCMMAG